MIRLVDGLPDNVVGFEAVGEVRAGDYDTVFEPAIAAALESNDTIRVLYILGDDFDGYSGGAMWEDAKIGVSRLSKWERIAVVTDHGLYADGIKAFGWMIPGEIKVYATSEVDAAKTWIAE